MSGWDKKSIRIFAPVSLGFVLTLSSTFAASAGTKRSGPDADPSASVKRQSASAQFERAEDQRTALNAKPGDKRTLAEYKQVVMSYRRVALITPRAPEVPDSLLAVAELYTEMGDHFGRSYYQQAVDSYEFLVREYPSHKNCQDALLRIAKLQRDQLAEASQAQKTYEEFLKRFPRSQKRREVEEALAELALLQNSNGDDPAAKNDARESSAVARTGGVEDARPSAPVHSGGKSVASRNSGEIPRVRRVRTSLTGDTTQVTIDLDDSVEFTSGRISNPDRIFFDLHAARLAPELARSSIHVEGDLLTAVRVAQNHSGVVRVALDVNGVRDYTAVLTSNPTQLVIDLYGNSFGSEPVRSAGTRRTDRPAGNPAASENAASNGPREKQAVAANHPSDETARPAEAPATSNAKNVVTGTLEASNSGASSPSPRNSLPSAKNSKSRSSKALRPDEKPDLLRSASVPQPTRDGQATLTRTLGLKIGRIVIDPGHGGHDTGTIGPTGLMEKDLCLDVALRLGKIIEQRLPGADVIYTRSDDTFIPLEERTNIANQAKADLFISIHANSSHDSGARGIETYYLNLKGSAEAMEVASRENATAQEGVHDLESLVKKIAQTEKIDESKEFAQDIQDSLAKRIQNQKNAKNIKNRGVRKAPFVVLIGADMPSILTEISFLSNPADEKLLKQPEQRQRMAEGLYQGISSYLQNMNSMTVNLPGKKGPGQPVSSAAASVEQSRNQR
ncbi:MAG TPA: N-acetylmuramoyl-L-alanine amidase [Candidatus Acidoferrum sp.]|nr:N-acetylmuramoyl-L-alanine amidase [Candidatus Acidoferrum sp.]